MAQYLEHSQLFCFYQSFNNQTINHLINRNIFEAHTSEVYLRLDQGFLAKLVNDYKLLTIRKKASPEMFDWVLKSLL